VATTNDIDQNEGGIPKHILSQLSEHTEGGFVLFYFNSKHGSPEEIMNFDSTAYFLAFQKHIYDWSRALQDISVESEKHHLAAFSQSAHESVQQTPDSDESEPPEELFS